MSEPESHGDDGRPLTPNVEKQSSISPDKAAEPASVQNLPLISSDQGSLPSLPFNVSITDGGLEIAARIKREGDLDKLIHILQAIKPLLRDIYGQQPSVLADPPDPPEIEDHAQRTSACAPCCAPL